MTKHSVKEVKMTLILLICVLCVMSVMSDEVGGITSLSTLSSVPPIDTNEEPMSPDESPEGGMEELGPSDTMEVSSDTCTEAMTSVCSLGEHYSFEESLRCLENHVTELQGACSAALNVMMSNLQTECGSAVSSLCPSSAYNDESVYVLTCLSNHRSELSTECQKQFDVYLNEEYPCSKEASKFCSQDSTTSPEQTLSCLTTAAAASPEEISLQCATILDGYLNCRGGPDDEGDPKPKPRPFSRHRKLNTDGESSWETRKPKPKPKPPPSNGGDGGRDWERRCWRTGGSLGAEGSGSFLSGLKNLGYDSDESGEEPTGRGVVAGSLFAVVALVGIVGAGIKYRQRSDETESNGGYWRAPSIQAMLYDDSDHPNVDSSSDRIVMGSVVEMNSLSKGDDGIPSADGVQVTLSPIADSDEIRV